MTEPKWRRRAAARPDEIADAAVAEFAARGYAAARLTDIAARAGVSKAALYNYYPTKADLFRAVLLRRASPAASALEAAAAIDVPFATVIDLLLTRLAAALGAPELRRLARMVVAESGNFPELARGWHFAVVAPALSTVAGLIARAQVKGEARGGDPRLMAMSLVGPMLMGAIWTEVMEPIGAEPVALTALAQEHRATLLAGLLAQPVTGSRTVPSASRASGE